MSEPKTMYEDLIEQNSILLNEFKQQLKKLLKQLQQLKQQLQLEKDNVAELNELLISYKEENEELERENEVLLHTIHEWQHDCNNKREKLEKIKDYCKNKTLSYCDCSKDILQIIEGDNNE